LRGASWRTPVPSDLRHREAADLGCLNLSGKALGGCRRWSASKCEAFRRGRWPGVTASGRELRVVIPSAAILLILAITRVDRVLRIYLDLDDALRD
jgi:hypothetical protein